MAVIVYGCWIYNYLYNWCLYQIKFVRKTSIHPLVRQTWNKHYVNQVLPVDDGRSVIFSGYSGSCMLSACPFTVCRGFFTPIIGGTFYMQGYKVKEKTTIVPHCTPSFKTQWAPLPAFKMAAVTKDRNFFNCSLLLQYKPK